MTKWFIKGKNLLIKWQNEFLRPNCKNKILEEEISFIICSINILFLKHVLDTPPPLKKKNRKKMLLSVL